MTFEVLAKLTGVRPRVSVFKFKSPKRYRLIWLTRSLQAFLAGERPEEFRVRSAANTAGTALAEEKGVKFLP